MPHEHRRELRGKRVFCAWLNHDDSRGINSLDMLETANGRGWIKHYMFDFGSLLGSVVAPQRGRAGGYIYEHHPAGTRWSPSVCMQPWQHIHYPDVPQSVGRVESDAFDP